MTFDIDAERARFEQAAMDHFHTRRQQGNVLDDNGSPITRESLFWRTDEGDYGVRMFNAAWWGWKEASRVATRKTCEVPTLDEAIRQAHWAHWAAEEHHVVAVSVRHLRLLANHNDTAAPQAAAQPPAPGEAAREYMTGPSQAVELSDEEQVVLLRFNETCEDGQGYDVKTSMVSRLAEIVVVSRKFGSVYFVTEYGQRVIAEVGGA